MSYLQNVPAPIPTRGVCASGQDGAMDSDWQALTEAAENAATRSYAPYSGLAVGAAARLEDGRIVTGSNVENASYGLSLCAETSLVAALHAGGFARPLALVAVSGGGDLLMPCGRCRQLLHEAGGPDMSILSPDGPLRIGDLLPHAFGPDDLPHPPSGGSDR